MRKETCEFAFQTSISKETHGLKTQKNWNLKTENAI